MGALRLLTSTGKFSYCGYYGYYCWSYILFSWGYISTSTGRLSRLKNTSFLVSELIWMVNAQCFSCRYWLFHETSRRTDENEARPNDGNNVPFGAGGFHWQWSNFLLKYVFFFLLCFIYYKMSCISFVKTKKIYTYISDIAHVSNLGEKEENRKC